VCVTGRGAAWLARLSGGQEVPGSNPGAPIAERPANAGLSAKRSWFPEAPRGQEIADALMQLPHVTEFDAIAAEEIGSIVARLEAIDRDLDQRGHFGRGGARVLLEHKARLSRELRTWLREFGGTPKVKADFARALSESGGLAGEIARRREQGR
jgi:hypothetical protein